MNRDVLSSRLINTEAAAVALQLDHILKEYGRTAGVTVDQSRNCVLVRASAETRQFASQLIRTLDKARVSRGKASEHESHEGPVTVEGYPVNRAQIGSLISELRREFPSSTGARLAADSRASQVIAIAPRAVQEKIGTHLRAAATRLREDDLTQPDAVADIAASSYRLRNISPGDFERRLEALFGDRVETSSDDSGETISVYTASDRPGTPSLRLNRQTSEVTFEAAGPSGRSWRQLAIALDQTDSRPDGITQLVPLRRADPETVREAITAIREAAARVVPGKTLAAVPVTRAAQSQQRVNLAAMIFRPAEGDERSKGNASESEHVPSERPADDEGEIGDATEDGDDAGEPGMLGDVQVEFIPELGVLILRGNKRDVERVRQIIDQIEKESAATEPDVDVLVLNHANGEALAQVIAQVYEDVYAPRLGSLSITALVRPNAILVVGRQENIEVVAALVRKLDKRVAPDSQIRVFRLLHMSALNAEQYIQSFYGAGGAAAGQQQQQEARGLAPRLVVIGDYRSNSLIVQASPRDMKEVAALLQQLDVEKTEAKIQVRIFPLQNSLASDMQTVLQQTLTEQGLGAAGQQATPAAGQQARQTSRSVQIVGIDQEGNKLVESGLLTDVTITADDNSNAVVVKAPAHSMGLIAALVEELDRIPAAESQIKVFQIEHGDATNLTVMLQQLFGQPVTAGQVGVFSQTVGRTFGAQQQLSQTTAGESSLIPLSFGVDPRTNSIIASGSRADLAVVEAILLRLDEGDLRRRRLIVYRLNNAPAEQVAEALTRILTEQQTLLQQQQSQQFSLISQFEFLDQQVFVVPEIISNSLIVSATPEYYEQITEVIQDLDRRPPMVMLQVVVCLVRLDDKEEMGVELGIQDSLLFDRGSVVDGLLQPGFNFVGQPLGNATEAARGLLAGQAFGSFGVGRSSGTEGFPGLVLSASNESINLLIRALVSNSRAQVLSRPQIMTLNNVPASVLVGQRIPQITDFQTTNTGGTVNSVELIDTGISLGVIPRVTPDGLIIMDLEVNDSQAGDPAEGITVGVSDGVPIQSPIFDDITAITTVAARGGQTVVFGGLISSNRTDTFRGIPYLSQVPVLGHLFRFDTRGRERTELIFFLTPHIVMDDEDLERLNQREAERISWCYADVVDIHGDPGFQCGVDDQWHAGTPVIYPHLDPTAETLPPPDGEELMPQVTPEPAGAAASGTPSEQPFILPPGEREEGRPFVLPPDKRQKSKPFMTPPTPRDGDKPLQETPRESARHRTWLQGSNTGWKPPVPTEPWQPRTTTAQPATYLSTPSSTEATGTGEKP